MDHRSSSQRLTSGAAALLALAIAGALALVAAYAAQHPFVLVPLSAYPPTGAPSIDVHQGWVVGPAAGSLLSLAAGLAVAAWPQRPIFWLTAMAGSSALVVALAMPPWLTSGLAGPLPSRLGDLALVPLCFMALGVGEFVASALGWRASPPVPRRRPSWPTHHEAG